MSILLMHVIYIQVLKEFQTLYRDLNLHFLSYYSTWFICATFDYFSYAVTPISISGFDLQ